MPAEPKPYSYLDEEHRPYVTIGTDEKELRDLAEAIVCGASIAHAQITDLRDLIEAVQRHSGVTLRPPKDAEEISESRKVEPTALVIHGGCVYRCDCSKLDIRVTLTAATFFDDEARFDGATFGDEARFDGATFGEQVSFDGAIFGKRASFDRAHFGKRVNFGGATFGESATFDQVTFGAEASFGGATFGEKADFGRATFGEQANFVGATFGNEACFCGARFGHKPSFRGVTFGDRTDFGEATFVRRADFFETRFGDVACFAGATFDSHANFGGATLGKKASFRKATFGSAANFQGAIFGKKANFSEATLRGAGFQDAVLRRANFQLAEIGGLNVSGADLVGVRGLWGPHRATEAGQLINEHYVQTARFHRKWDWMDWTRLRFIGALRLFGVSYGSIILIVIYVKLAEWYNTSFAVHVREDAQRKIDEGIDWRWREILANLPDLPVPGHLAGQLIMILVLAIGATLYQFFCPDLVKEATETRWTRQMNQPLIEYRSAMWSRIVLRYFTALFLVAGGAYTVVYLSLRLWDALRYLFGH